MSEATEKKEASTKEAKKTRIEKREIKRKFWFKLTAKETEEMGKLAGELDAQIIADEDTLAELKRQRQSKIKEKRSQLSQVLSTLKAQKELREVDTVEVKNFAKKEISYLVGSKVMESRDMTNDELQTSFNLEKREAERKAEKQAGTQSKAEAALRAEAKAFQDKKNGKKTPDEDVKSVIREETSKLTKRSSVDDVPAAAAQ